MNVLVIGSGGREHALVYSLNQSTKVNTIYAIPGNPGMKSIASIIDINPMDNIAIKEFVLEHDINLVIPGSEVYLENGIADTFLNLDVIVFGPSKNAARIETSKEFAKDLMKKYDIPTASYEVFDDYEKALDYLHNTGVPIVLKYDGLAGGKGVVVATTLEQADEALKDMLKHKKYGDSKVVIEEFLEGPEFSLMCFVNGETVIPMPIAQDHKRLHNNDLGPNTGGMGIYSPVPIIPDSAVTRAMDEVMYPISKAMIKEKASFTGFLYGGLMLTENGPKVIEFNARFGDPEAEVILPKLQSDIIDVIESVMSNQTIKIEWDDLFNVGVVLASKGYPFSYDKGFEIRGIESIDNVVFHMGTKQENDSIVTNGGRVLLINGKGTTIEKAIENAYDNVAKIKCDNLMFRTDIGNKSVKR